MKVIISEMMGRKDGTQSVQGRGEKCIKKFSQETWRKGTSWEDSIKMYSSGYSAYEPTAGSCQYGSRNMDTDDKVQENDIQQRLCFCAALRYLKQENNIRAENLQEKMVKLRIHVYEWGESFYRIRKDVEYTENWADQGPKRERQ